VGMGGFGGGSGKQVLKFWLESAGGRGKVRPSGSFAALRMTAKTYNGNINGNRM
jgi:hypothetical protein